MIRPRPAEIDRVALAVESDEAFNPVALGVLGPAAFGRRILPWTGTEVDGNRGVSLQCRGSPFRLHFFSRGR